MEKRNPKISFVSPVYKADKILDKLIFEIKKVMEEVNETFEIILVDDRSPDNSWDVMKKLAFKYQEIKGINLESVVNHINFKHENKLEDGLKAFL